VRGSEIWRLGLVFKIHGGIPIVGDSEDEVL
jgi:hypothetical protein